VNRGEIWWVEHPEAGRRPHLLLTRQAAIPVLSAYIAVIPSAYFAERITKLGPDRLTEVCGALAIAAGC